MKNNSIKAVEMLAEGEYTCVLCKDDIVYTSTERGVKPLLEWYDRGINVQGFSAADKVIGKAAAFIYVLLGVNDVYAPVISEGAKHILETNGIKVQCKLLVKEIINRTGTGRCPMEETVDMITEAKEAMEAVKRKIAQLQRGEKQDGN